MIVAPGSPHKQPNQHDGRDNGRDHHAAHSAAAVSTGQIVTVQVVTVQIIVKHLVFLLKCPEKQQAPITNVPRQMDDRQLLLPSARDRQLPNAASSQDALVTLHGVVFAILFSPRSARC
jgi:hypothetical protein